MLPDTQEIRSWLRAALAAEPADDDRSALWRTVYRSAERVASRCRRYGRDLTAADVVDTWASYCQQAGGLSPRDQDNQCGLRPLSAELAAAGFECVPLDVSGSPLPDPDDEMTVTADREDFLPIDEADAQRHRDRALLWSAELPAGVYGSTLPEPHARPDTFRRPG